MYGMSVQDTCRYLLTCEHAGSRRCKACKAIQAEINHRYRLRPHKHVPPHVIDNIAAQEREITPLELLRGIPIQQAFTQICSAAWGMTPAQIVDAAHEIGKLKHRNQIYRLLQAKPRKPA